MVPALTAGACFNDDTGAATRGSSGADTSAGSSGSSGSGFVPTTSESAGPTTTVGPATEGGTGDSTGPHTSSFTDGMSDPSAGSESSTGAPNTCDNGACFAPGGCVECSVVDLCADVYAACLATPNDECTNYSNCAGACKNDAACLKDCYLQYPGGYDPSWALADCSLCAVCPSSCAVEAGAYCAFGGGGPGKVDVCDEIGDCGKCSACTVNKGCADAVATCNNDPECLPYQSCVQACPENDAPCLDACEDAYPNGYVNAWAQFDCAVCDECPTSCPTAQAYCEAGGGGPNSECTTNAECVDLYDALPFCVQQTCVECLNNDNCLDPGFPTCVDNFCQ